MPVELRMPALGMAMEEGKVVAWLVEEGERVTRGQIVAQIESEKVAYEVESPADGVVGKILVPVNAEVPVGTPLVAILAPGESIEREAAVASGGAERRGASATAARQRLSPRARKLAETLGVDPSTLAGSGPDGTIVEKDIREAAARGARGAPAQPRAEDAPFVLRPLSSMRRTIAERMAQSAHEAPHLYVAVEVDGTALLRYRETYGPRLQTETAVKLTLTDLLLHLTARTLPAHRSLNASFTPDGIREWNEVNLGLAVAIDDGLVAPVIRGAHRRSLAELMVARADLVERARARKLTADDLRGGTFTLSNLGGLGIDFFTSILNPPEGGILSVGTLRERPAVVEGQVVARPTMLVGLTLDHRVTDGAAGARFLADLRARVEASNLSI